MPLIAYLEDLDQQAGYLLSLADAASVSHDQIVRTDDGWRVPSAVSDDYVEDDALAYGTSPSGTSGAVALPVPSLLATDYNSEGSDIYGVVVAVNDDALWPGSFYVGATGVFRLMPVPEGGLSAAGLWVGTSFENDEVLPAGQYALAYFCDTGEPAPGPLGSFQDPLPTFNGGDAGKVLGTDGSNKFWTFPAPDAYRVVYDNSTSMLTATDAQAALDEIVARIVALETP